MSSIPPNRKPPWPFEINRDSYQAKNLLFWYPHYIGQDSTVYDFGPIRNNGPFYTGGVTSPTWVKDPIHGNVLKYVKASDGDGVEIPDNDYLDITTNITLTAWVYLLEPITNNGHIISKYQAYSLRLFDKTAIHGLDFTIWQSSVELDILPNQSPTPSNYQNEWLFCAGTYDGAQSLTLLIRPNGQELLATKAHTGTIDTSTNPVYLGKTDPTWSTLIMFQHGGYISDARIYDRVLSVAELRSLYHPTTRWDLYQAPTRRAYSVPAAAPPVPDIASYAGQISIPPSPSMISAIGY